MENKKKSVSWRRKRRVRAKIFGTKKRPRLSIFRSNKYISAQIIDDESGKTLVSVSEKDLPAGKAGLGKEGKGKIEKAKFVGSVLAKKSKKKKIDKVVFDRGSYLYHGRVKALAEGAREGGLNF